MKHFIHILLAAALLLSLSACKHFKSGKGAEGDATSDSTTVNTKSMSIEEKLAAMPAEPVFDIVTGLGTIKVRLYADTPYHRANFARLAFSGFYDGTQFHRVIYDFMIQGGDPLTKDPGNKPAYGTGGPGYTVRAEILPNHHHFKGALAAARKGDHANPMKESSGSQFYIVQSEEGCSHLDGEYSIFGETIEGFEVIDAIASVPTDGRSVPLNPVYILSVKYDEELN